MVTLVVAHKFKENVAEVLPVTVCGLIFILYILAYFRCLTFIDGISALVILYGLIYWFKSESEKRKEWLQETKKLLIHPVTIMIFVSVILVSILVQDRIALWWDDINFWATDVKSIYHLNGFAGK